MAGGEHQTEEVVADVVVDRGLQLFHRRPLARPQLAAELLVLALDTRAAPHEVDRAVLGGGHEPGAGVVRHPGLGPPLERRHERILGELLGHAHVAHDPAEPADETGRLDPPDRVDGAMRVGGGHHHRSQHLHLRRARRGAAALQRCGSSPRF
jgi:hypothetical protein